MKVEFWGAAQTVTGSMHLLHYKGKKILLDCGLYQGKRKEAFRRNRETPFDAGEVDFVILSHAHIDHSGNLPTLVGRGFAGPIYSTAPTADIAVYLLLDSAKIQESDVKYVNKKRARDNQTPFEPLYVQSDAVEAIKRFRPKDFGDTFSPMPGMTVQFHVAGHMIGAAVVEIVMENEDSNSTRLIFSGDIGRFNMPILKDPTTVAGADYLIMESTYGNRLHSVDGDAKQMLLDLATEAHEQNGKLIIPAFSVGRTQEIIYRLNVLQEDGILPPIPVFVDSPLAVNATDVFREHHDVYDEEMIERVLTEDDSDPLSFEGLHYIRKVEYSKALNKFKGAAVIISASGMCTAGRILHHLKNQIGKPTTTILFAGYQAPFTLGRMLLDGKKEVRIYGEPYEVKAKIARLEASSGHADQGELVAWAEKTASQGEIKRVALVHCELDSAEALAKKLEEKSIGPVIIPAKGDSMELA